MTLRFGKGITIALITVLVLLAVVPRAFDPATWALAQAVRELGPVGGWRCTSGATYVYDPTRERPDSALLVDPPEDTVLAHAPDQAIDHVDADLRGGDSLVWTHTATQDSPDTIDSQSSAETTGTPASSSGPRRVYVLSPGRLQPLTVDQAGRTVTVCNARLGDWRIVGEQEM
jgi:hypothetical protein